MRKPTRGASDGGPGAWGPGKNHGSNRSQAYEEQVTGVTVEESYIVEGVEFDGFHDGILHDAKGLGYYDLTQAPFGDNVIAEMVDSANDQLDAVRAAGADTPIRWHLAEPEMLELLQDMQRSGDFPAGIELVHTPPDF